MHLSASASSKHQYSRRKQRKWRKPQDKPKHPLSAYNVFFQSERARMMANSLYTVGANKSVSPAVSARESGMQIHGPNLPLSSSPTTCLPHLTEPSMIRKLGFAGLARTIAAQWKTLDATSKSSFEDKARIDKARYQKELTEWKERKASHTLQTPVVCGDDDDDDGTPVVEPTGEDAPATDSLSIPNCVTPEKNVRLLVKDRSERFREELCAELHHMERTCGMDAAQAGESGCPLLPFNAMDFGGHRTISDGSFSFPPEPQSTSWPDHLFAPSLVSSTIQTGPLTSYGYPTMSLRLATNLALLKLQQERMADFNAANTGDMEHQMMLAQYNSFPGHNERYYMQTPRELLGGSSTKAGCLPSCEVARHVLTRAVVSASFETEEAGDSRNLFTPSSSNSDEDDEDEICVMDPNFDLNSPVSWDEKDE